MYFSLVYQNHVEWALTEVVLAPIRIEFNWQRWVESLKIEISDQKGQ